MHPFQDQIDRERRKIALLKGKIAECESRVTALLSMSEDDELDKLLDKEMEPPTANVSMTAVTEESFSEDRKRHKRIPPNWVALITYLGEQGKSFRQVEAFLASGGASMSPGAARTGLMNYRRDFGFVESPRLGFYKATSKGLEAIEAQKEESLAL